MYASTTITDMHVVYLYHHGTADAYLVNEWEHADVFAVTSLVPLQ